jgi:hypothetical protein
MIHDEGKRRDGIDERLNEFMQKLQQYKFSYNWAYKLIHDNYMTVTKLHGERVVVQTAQVQYTCEAMTISIRC